MILPAATLGLVLYGEYALIVRSAMLETLGEDYILTARAKGLRNWAIVRRHALRNSLLPITTLVALSLGYVIGGAILVETVFSYPGIGLLTYNAIQARDYPLLQASFLFLTLSVVLANYVADLLYFKLDPRIRCERMSRQAGSARAGRRPARRRSRARRRRSAATRARSGGSSRRVAAPPRTTLGARHPAAVRR